MEKYYLFKANLFYWIITFVLLVVILFFTKFFVLVVFFSLAVEPTYPQICIHHNVIEKPSVSVGLTPMELCAELHSLPCSLYFTSDDHSTIIHLVSLVSFLFHCFPMVEWF